MENYNNHNTTEYVNRCNKDTANVLLSLMDYNGHTDNVIWCRFPSVLKKPPLKVVAKQSPFVQNMFRAESKLTFDITSNRLIFTQY